MMEKTRKSQAAAWRSGLAAGVAAIGLGLFAAAPAQAKNEFENGFEDQIGRLLAYEVFHIGRTVLHGGYAHRYAGHHDRHPGYHRSHRKVIPPPRAHRSHRHHHPGHAQPCHVDHRRDRRVDHRYGHDRRDRDRYDDDDDHVVYERYEYERKSPPRRGHRDARRADWRF